MVQLGVSVLEFLRPDPSRCFLCPPLVLALNTGTTGGATDPGLELGPVTVLLDFLARNFGIILGSWLLLELTVWDGPSRRLLILHDVCDVAGSWSAGLCLGVLGGKGFGLAVSLCWDETLFCRVFPGWDWTDRVWEQLLFCSVCWGGIGKFL